MIMPSSQEKRSKRSSVREFLAAWWRQPGVRLQLVFIALLAYIVQRDGVIRLVVTLMVVLPTVTVFAVLKFRKHGAEMFNREGSHQGTE